MLLTAALFGLAAPALTTLRSPRLAAQPPADTGRFAGCDIPAFDVLWRRFDRHYAGFGERLHGRTWDEWGRVSCARLGANPTDEELYATMLAMLRALDDGHSSLTAPSLGRDEDAWVSVYRKYDATYALVENAETHYLTGPLTRAARGRIAWGLIEGVGYLSIASLEELSPGGSERGDRRSAVAAVRSAFRDLKGAGSMIVDLRANEGGWDSVGLAIAARFSGQRAVAWTEQTRNGPAHDAFTSPTPVYVRASAPGAFKGNVALLTSGGTFSAAETMALAMRERDHVTIVGERTSGHFSDLSGRRLPNGWGYTMSAERYHTADGVVVEAIGVTPDRVVVLDVEALEAGRDVLLEEALAALHASLTPSRK